MFGVSNEITTEHPCEESYFDSFDLIWLIWKTQNFSSLVKRRSKSKVWPESDFSQFFKEKKPFDLHSDTNLCDFKNMPTG